VRKEHVLKDIGSELYPDFKWQLMDKIIPNNCKIRRRPDWFIDYGTHAIIMECDENEHKGYDNQCAFARLNDISIAVNFKPVVYIRFNPDSYSLNGIRKEGIFSTNINGLEFDEKEAISRLKEAHKYVAKYSDWEYTKRKLKGNLQITEYLFFSSIAQE
jgi:hypothetical protein